MNKKTIKKLLGESVVYLEKYLKRYITKLSIEEINFLNKLIQARKKSNRKFLDNIFSSSLYALACAKVHNERKKKKTTMTYSIFKAMIDIIDKAHKSNHKIKKYFNEF